MRTFDARHYHIVGFVESDGAHVWKIRANDGIIIYATEAKYVDAGRVFFLKDDGSVENKLREVVDLPSTII